jgi:subtilase family serine protease
VERSFVLAVGGENDISNVFAQRPDAFLEETLLRATTSPFAVTMHGGQTFRDGFGYTMQYSLAAHGSIVITFSRPVYDADADLRDGETGQNVGSNFDSVANTLTITEADINSINGGATPLTVDSDPWTFHRIQIQADAITPLNGDGESLFSTLFFNAVP